MARQRPQTSRKRAQKNNTPNPQNNDNSNKRSLKTLFTNGIWVFKTLFKMSPWITSLYFFSDITSSALPVVTSYLFARVVDQVINLMKSQTQLSTLNFRAPIFGAIALLCIFAILSQALKKLKRYTEYHISHYEYKIQEVKLYQKISSLDPQQFEDPKISSVIVKAQDNIFKMREFLKSSTALISDATSAIIAAVICIKISPILALLTVFLALPNSFFLTKFLRSFWEYYNHEIEKFKMLSFLRGSMTFEKKVPEHRISRANNLLIKMSSNISRFLYGKDIEINKTFQIEGTFGDIIAIIGYVAVLIFLIGRVLANAITIGQFTFYEGQFSSLSNNLDSLIGTSFELFDMSTYITFVRKVFELEPAIKSGTRKIAVGKPPIIEFKNVSFRYPNSKKLVLRNINLIMHPGKNVAIVGENGAGKTTLIKLLLRFYDPTHGEILVDGIPLKEVDLKTYYSLISALFQEFNAYGELDVKTNISIGRPDKAAQLSDIQVAAEKADADEYIRALDKKYNQRLNKQFTNGTNLSTGQWQKLALARMFYRDTPILVLDEPTASIDAAAEYKIFKKIYSFIKDKTVIIISHRFSTVRNADTIYVLDKGKIVESGTHSELLKKTGKYANAFMLQAEGYSCEDYRGK